MVCYIAEITDCVNLVLDENGSAMEFGSVDEAYEFGEKELAFPYKVLEQVINVVN